ncbi:sporulation protein YjcZ [Geobacillus sp. LEMMY01]|nr:sporulation protein YjcZ [Geobacillus sp. LEMMY01]
MKEVSAMSSLVSSGYALVIVLFILLIIVGCVCVAW